MAYLPLVLASPIRTSEWYLYANADLVGADYGQRIVYFNGAPPTMQSCAQMCSNDAYCNAWTFVNRVQDGGSNECYLKHATGCIDLTPRARGAMYSGQKKTLGNCAASTGLACGNGEDD